MQSCPCVPPNCMRGEDHVHQINDRTIVFLLPTIGWVFRWRMVSSTSFGAERSGDVRQEVWDCEAVCYGSGNCFKNFAVASWCWVRNIDQIFNVMHDQRNKEFTKYCSSCFVCVQILSSIVQMRERRFCRIAWTVQRYHWQNPHA